MGSWRVAGDGTEVLGSSGLSLRFLQTSISQITHERDIATAEIGGSDCMFNLTPLTFHLIKIQKGLSSVTKSKHHFGALLQ